MPIIHKKEEEKKAGDISINKEDINDALMFNDEKEKLNNENISKNNGDEIIIKNSEYYKQRIKKILKNIFILSCFFFYYYYFSSLEGCYLGEDVCAEKKRDWISLKAKEEIISAIIMTFMIQLIMFKKIRKIHIFHIIIILLLFLLYSHGYEFDDHGYFNFLYYWIIIALLNIALIPVDILLFCIIKKVKKIIIYLYILFTIIILSFLYYYYFIVFSNCDDWTKGLNNTYIENNNSKYGCEISTPKYCIYKVFNNFQDYSKINGKNCENYRIKNEKERLFSQSKSPYINDKTNIIGYPITNKGPACFGDYLFLTNHLCRQYYLNNIVDMKNEEILEKYYKNSMPEVQVEFSKNNRGKITVNVIYNKTLSEERKLSEKKNIPFSENLLLLYVDSVSRGNSMRKLKKTLKFFKKFISYKGGYNEKYPKENYHSFEFLKYYAFEHYTSYNWPFLFYGQKRQVLNKTFYVKYFKENGYVTGNVNDFCDKENTRTYHNLTIEEAYDHQFILCDPNNDGVNTHTKRCLYGKLNIDHLLEYSEQFWRLYNNNRKLLAVVTNDGHEGTLNVLKYIDESVVNFLESLFNDNLLKDTTVFLMSDHGTGMPSVYYMYDFYQIEYSLPMLFILINDKKNATYEEQYMYLNENQQSFITAFDIYNTFGNILYGDKYNNIKNKTLKEDTFKSEYGISLFNKINNKERSPKYYSHINRMNTEYCKINK